MPDTVLVALITVGLPMVGAAIAFLWKDRKQAQKEAKAQNENALEEAKRAGREEERAEAYKRASKEALDRKNREIEELEDDLEEAKRWIVRLTDTELPALQNALANREQAIQDLSAGVADLSSSYQAIVKLLEEVAKELSSRGKEVES